MNSEQNEVLDWWQSGQDYKLGVMLLSRFCRNKTLVFTLQKPAKEKFGGKTKLAYELPKAVGLDWKHMPSNSSIVTPQIFEKTEKKKHETKGENKFAEAKAADQDDENEGGLRNVKPLDHYPPIIRKLKYDYSDFYKQRSMLHQTMRRIPEENTANNVAARARLLADVKSISGKMEHLFKFIDAYEQTGAIPLEEDVWPKPEMGKTLELPRDIDELKRRKKNLQTDNTKSRNRLLYQQRTKADKEKPMPHGPTRSRLENAIAKREKEIKKIDALIFEIEENVD